MSSILGTNDYYYLGAYIGLLLIQWALKRVGSKFKVETNYLVFGEIVCFIFAWDTFLTSITYSGSPNFLSMFTVYVLFTFSTSSFFGHDGDSMVIAGGFSIAIGFVVAIIGYPIFKIAGNGMDVIYTLWWGGSSSFFYLIIPFNSAISGLVSYLFVRYLDVARAKLFGKSNLTIQRTRLRSIVTYFQVIPIGMLPFVIAQSLLGPSYLGGITLTLYKLCAGQLLPLAVCISVVLLGERIFSGNFLKITSIFSLVSFIAILYSAFQNIVFNVNSGAFLIALIITSVCSSAVGIGLSRCTFQRLPPVCVS